LLKNRDAYFAIADPTRREILDVVAKNEVVSAGSVAASYPFRHVLTQEASYNSMPFAFRAGLHRRVGEYIEQVEFEDLEPHLDLLAHHFRNGDNDIKKLEYLRRA
jgi:predicted ATPase